MTKFDTEKIRSQLKRWQEKLLDMSKSNPLLGLNRARAAKFKVKNPDVFTLFQQLAIDSNELRMPLVKKIKKKATNDLFNQDEAETEEEKEVYKIEEGDIEVEINTPADLKRKLRRIYDNSRVTVEERGVVTLYVAFGTIHWNDDALGNSVSPILLVPCEFVYKGPNVALRLRMADEEIQINPAILYYFREKHKIDLSPIQERFDQKELVDQDSLKTLLKDIKKAVNEQKWQVAEEVWLGTFSFESLVLYQDLKVLAERACSNKIIAAFAHAIKGAEESSEVLGEDIDSLKTPEVVPVPILPVDSSQLKSLTYVSMGKHLVVHGPPGTGKSQTIGNIIADALGKNKKVLFVSAKMAALSVVFDRLKKEGLGQFCLEAHGTKAGKVKIIEELKNTLESDDYNNVGPLEEELEALCRTREQLNEYVIALHTIVNPFGVSVFRAIGRFAKLQRAPDVRGDLPWDNILEVSKEEVAACLEAFGGVAQMAELFNSKNTHPWRGFTNLDYNIQLQEQIETDLQFLIKSFSDIEKLIEKLKKLVPVQVAYEDLFALIPAFNAISIVTRLSENWWSDDVSKIEKRREVFNEAASFARERKEKEALYNQFSTLHPKETTQLLSKAVHDFQQWNKRISFSYLQWLREVKQKLNPKIGRGFKNYQNYYEVSKRLLEIEDWFKKNASLLREEISENDFRDPSALERVLSSCQVALLLREVLKNYNWEKYKVTAIDEETSNAAAALVSLLDDQDKTIREIASKIDKLWPNGFAGKVFVLQTPLAQFQARANEILNNLDKLRDWTLLQRAMKRCEDLGLGSFIDTKDVQADYLPDAFEKRFLRIWIDAVISRTPCLAEFSGLKHQELISKFKILDKKIRRLANLYVKATAAAHSRSAKGARSDLGNGGEIGILRYEMQKKKRVKPLRKLFSEIPHLLQALKPCFLMSPVSVSTFLKPDAFHFDLVIFDEASQLPTPEAIPAILRAEQVIVAGDSNQLPPTSFFEASLIEEDGDYEEELYSASLESLLDDCVAVEPVFQREPLKWHYRSRDERLINFSNHYFYDNRLITFPSPHIDNSGRGVILEYIHDGIWDRGKSRTNRKEARRVAQLAIEHFKKFPDKSLGVVALNTTQREAIEEALDEERTQHLELEPFFSSLRDEPFFVKSLENVQGDERDVIIISVGYGKDRDGALTLNFGPLNMEGGWRRLNVLVTRAKWQVILVTSLRSAELHRVNPQNRGAVALRNYIEYAEREGVLPPEPAQNTDGETNDFEDSVRAVLMERGYIVDAQVGAGIFRIDLAIRDPRDKSRYLIGVECDGATYHSSRVARDRDLLREEILRGMGWKLYRIWSTEWFQNKDTAIKLMLDNIERARFRDKTESVPTASVTETDVDFKPMPAPQIKKKYRAGLPYKKYSRRHRRETLMRNSNTYRLEEILVNIIDLEGPIHEDVLRERLKKVFGVAKIGANISSNFKEALESACYNKKIEKKKSFIWKRGKELKAFRTPGDDVRRTLRHISPQEIGLAVLYLVEDQFGMMREQIPQSIAKLFEDSRMDPDKADWVREIVDELIDKNILVASGNHVNLA